MRSTIFPYWETLLNKTFTQSGASLTWFAPVIYAFAITGARYTAPTI